MDGVTAQPALLFKRVLIGFWALFFSLVALTNLIDLLDTLGAFDWTFLNSQNYDYLRSVVVVYEVGAAPTKLLLAGALAIESVAAVLGQDQGVILHGGFRLFPGSPQDGVAHE